ncbi:MAG: hypothetical protein ACK5M9_08550, partial [Mycobacterium sp.]
DIYTGGLVSELTTFASVTALLLFLSGVIGSAIGRWLIDRNAPPVDSHGGAQSGSARADTDVFEAIRSGEGPTGEIAAATARAEEQAAAVATIERDAPTEAIPTVDTDAKTEVIRIDTDDAGPDTGKA